MADITERIAKRLEDSRAAVLGQAERHRALAWSDMHLLMEAADEIEQLRRRTNGCRWCALGIPLLKPGWHQGGGGWSGTAGRRRCRPVVPAESRPASPGARAEATSP